MSRDVLGTVFDIFIICVVMFIAPVIWQSYMMDSLTQKNVETIVQEFAETTASKGYIDEQTYYTFVKKLRANGELYDIDMMHTQEIVEPEYIGGVFTGNVMEYDQETYSGVILDEIEAHGAYLMDIGDQFKVCVSPASKSLGQSFMKTITGHTNSRFATVTRTVSGCDKDTFVKYFR